MAGTPMDGLEIGRFNWGACTLTWIWALGNRSFDRWTFLLLILCFAPVIGPFSAVALMVYSGLTGNARAWRNKRWESTDQFQKVQKRWAVVGVIQFVAALFAMVLLASLGER